MDYAPATRVVASPEVDDPGSRYGTVPPLTLHSAPVT